MQRPIEDIDVEAMVEDDLDDVIALEETVGGKAWSRTQHLDRLAGPHDESLVAYGRHGGHAEPALVGFVVAHRTADDVEILNVVVSEAVRRAGVGKALLVELFERARARGRERVLLEVRAGNVAAHRLYAGLGFEEVGRRAGYYRDPPDDAVLMTLVL